MCTFPSIITTEILSQVPIEINSKCASTVDHRDRKDRRAFACHREPVHRLERNIVWSQRARTRYSHGLMHVADAFQVSSLEAKQKLLSYDVYVP